MYPDCYCYHYYYYTYVYVYIYREREMYTYICSEGGREPLAATAAGAPDVQPAGHRRAAVGLRGSHLSKTTCLTQVFFGGGE